MPDTPSASPVEPPLGQALIPVIPLIALLGAAVYLFGDEFSFGPNQITLVLGTAVAGLVGLANGQSPGGRSRARSSAASPRRWAPC